MQQRYLYNFVPLQWRLELPTQHIIPLEVARIFLHIDLILGYIIDQIVGYITLCNSDGRRHRLCGWLGTRQRLRRGVLAASSLRCCYSVAAQLGATCQQRWRAAVACAGHGSFAAHALRRREVTHFDRGAAADGVRGEEKGARTRGNARDLFTPSSLGTFFTVLHTKQF